MRSKLNMTAAVQGVVDGWSFWKKYLLIWIFHIFKCNAWNSHFKFMLLSLQIYGILDARMVGFCSYGACIDVKSPVLAGSWFHGRPIIPIPYLYISLANYLAVAHPCKQYPYLSLSHWWSLIMVLTWILTLHIPCISTGFDKSSISARPINASNWSLTSRARLIDLKYLHKMKLKISIQEK